MAVLDPNGMFQKWIMSPDEVEIAPILTTLQKQHLKNLMADVAISKVHLPRLQENLQEEAEMQGWIKCLQHLIDLSNAAENQAVQGGKIDIVDPSGNF